MNLPFSPRYELAYIRKYLKENFYTKKYDRFLWWRRYCKNTPLHPNAPFKDKILNGDFDQSSFLYEVALTDHEINDKFKASIPPRGEVDYGKFQSSIQVDKARRKRLQEDYEKDEKQKLETLKSEFSKEFKMSRQDYDKEVLKTNGSIIDFYFQMEEKYGKRVRRLKPVPKNWK